MKHHILKIILGLIFGSSIACSTQWVDVDAELDGQGLLDQLVIAEQNSLQSQGICADISKFTDLYDSASSYIYFVDGPGPMGPAVSAASLINFDFMGKGDYSDLDLEAASVFYVEAETDKGRQSALLLNVQFKGETQGTTCVLESLQAPTVDNGEYVAIMGVNGNEKIILRSFYTADGELQQDIQFEVYDRVTTGEELFLGQFGGMAGFGG